MFQWHPLALVFLAGAVITAVLGAQALRHRREIAAAAPMAVCMVALAEWAVAMTLAVSVAPLSWQAAFTRAIFPGVAANLVGFFWFAHALVDPSVRFRRRTWALLCAEPVVITVMAATDPLHHLVYASMVQVGHPAMLQLRSGPVLLAHTAYCYLLITWTIMVLVRHWPGSSALFRRQAGPLLAGITVPALVNVVTLTLMTGRGSVDLTVIGFIALSTITWWTVRRHGLLRYSPVARGFVVDQVSDMILVIDPADRVVDVNPAADQFLRQARPALPASLTGLPSRDVLPPDVPAVGPGTSAEIAVPLPGRTVTLQVRSTELTDRRGLALGTVVVGRDVTALAEANRQLREQLDVIDKLRQSLSEQALRDPLTGLYNRRHLMSAMTSGLQRSREAGRPLSVLLIDLDHFKSINDRFGHSAGDDALKLTAEALQRLAWPDETVARYGGEEFVILLPGASAEVALRRAATWREAVGDVRVPSPKGLITLTFSAGLSSYPAHGADPESLLLAADQALYRAKALGRDQICLASGVTAGDHTPAV